MMTKGRCRVRSSRRRQGKSALSGKGSSSTGAAVAEAVLTVADAVVVTLASAGTTEFGSAVTILAAADGAAGATAADAGSAEAGSAGATLVAAGNAWVPAVANGGVADGVVHAATAGAEAVGAVAVPAEAAIWVRGELVDRDGSPRAGPLAAKLASGREGCRAMPWAAGSAARTGPGQSPDGPAWSVGTWPAADTVVAVAVLDNAAG